MTPDFFEQLLLGHEPVATREQIREHVEHLRLHVPLHAVTAELVQPCVELEGAESIDRTVGQCHAVGLLGVVAETAAPEHSPCCSGAECARTFIARSEEHTSELQSREN